MMRREWDPAEIYRKAMELFAERLWHLVRQSIFDVVLYLAIPAIVGRANPVWIASSLQADMIFGEDGCPDVATGGI
jgi:hypothetical protein